MLRSENLYEILDKYFSQIQKNSYYKREVQKFLMKKYEKPIVAVIENQSEGIYMASGCYTTTATIHQRPEIGRGD